MRVEAPLFRVDLPEGWRWVPDPEGGAAVPPGDPGALFFMAQAVEDPAELPSLRRMLAGFLTHRGRPVTPFDLKPVRLGGFKGFQWQYVEEDPGAEPHAWSLWIAGNPAAWVLVSYNCPARFVASHWTEVQDILATLELAGGD